MIPSGFSGQGAGLDGLAGSESEAASSPMALRQSSWALSALPALVGDDGVVTWADVSHESGRHIEARTPSASESVIAMREATAPKKRERAPMTSTYRWVAADGSG